MYIELLIPEISFADRYRVICHKIAELGRPAERLLAAPGPLLDKA